jgi:hypothetical protein
MSLKQPAWISAFASAMAAPAARTSAGESLPVVSESTRSDPADKATDLTRGEVSRTLAPNSALCRSLTARFSP